MTYKRFEDLPVWQEAIRLAEAVYELLEANKNGISFSFRDQVERAALSVSNNIAEGFERGTTAELLAFILYCAGFGRGSAFDALPALPASTVGEFQISNLKFEIVRGELLTTTPGVGGVAAEFRY